MRARPLERADDLVVGEPVELPDRPAPGRAAGAPVAPACSRVPPLQAMRTRRDWPRPDLAALERDLACVVAPALAQCSDARDDAGRRGEAQRFARHAVVAQQHAARPDRAQRPARSTSWRTSASTRNTAPSATSARSRSRSAARPAVGPRGVEMRVVHAVRADRPPAGRAPQARARRGAAVSSTLGTGGASAAARLEGDARRHVEARARRVRASGSRMQPAAQRREERCPCCSARPCRSS